MAKAPTFVALWNPKRWPAPEDAADWAVEYQEMIDVTSRGGAAVTTWSFGNRTEDSDVERGDRVFLFRVGRVREVLASGRLTSRIWFEPHWAGGAKATPYVQIELDRVFPLGSGLPITDVRREISEYHWHIMASGTELPEEVASKLEEMWRAHISVPPQAVTTVEPRRVAARGQGPPPRPDLEAGLVDAYRKSLEQAGHKTSRHIYEQAGGGPLKNDLFDETDSVLIEAKRNTRRQDVRLAVGQLLDYQRFHENPPELRVLLPEDPGESTLAYLDAIGISCAFATGKKRKKFKLVEPLMSRGGTGAAGSTGIADKLSRFIRSVGDK
jgi:hypothetical protein